MYAYDTCVCVCLCVLCSLGAYTCIHASFFYLPYPYPVWLRSSMRWNGEILPFSCVWVPALPAVGGQWRSYIYIYLCLSFLRRHFTAFFVTMNNSVGFCD